MNEGLIYHVTTSYTPEMIELDISKNFNGTIENIMRSVINLQDQGIRNALIALGWTPPPEGSVIVAKEPPYDSNKMIY